MPTKLVAQEPTVEVIVTDSNIDVKVTEVPTEIVLGASGPQGPRGTQVLSGSVDPSPVIGLIGDQYINTTTGYIFGPKTESGWGTGVLLGSGLTIEDVSFTYQQLVASDTWTIVHDLEFVPNIIVVDFSGNVIEGSYAYSGLDTIICTFSQPITGRAYLS
jgi:hypothetical protein